MAGEKLSHRMLRENETVLEAMVNHRFVRDIEEGQLPAAVFDRYLVYEGAFVEIAISIFALATAKAETIEQKRWLIGVMDALANQQVAYFERTLAARGVDPARFDLSEPRVVSFLEGMLDIAEHGTFLDIVVSMFAAEWMYWTWSKRAAAAPIADPFMREWIDMHSNEAFAAQAAWLRHEVDKAGARLGEPERSHLVSVFGRTQRLEIAFHAAAYGETR